MNLIVQKFSGSPVANADRLCNVADIITKMYSRNNDAVVVVSAQGDTTDDLIAKAREVNPRLSKQEMDMLLTAGGQMPASLLAMTIERMGLPVVSLLGWQAGSLIDASYGPARIKRATPDCIKKELDKRNIVIATGFQGVNRYNDMATLGRGGSDTSAVAIAVVMHADLRQTYTDVEGVYIANPRKIRNTKKIDVISYDEMLELTMLGAQVLNNRPVEMAKKYNTEPEALSSHNRVPGTIAKGATKMEKMSISGIAKDDEVVRVAIVGVPDRFGLVFKVLSKLSAKNVNVDITLQSIGCDGTKDISFTVSENHPQATTEALTPCVEQIGASSVVYDEGVAEASIVDTGVETHLGIATMVFEALLKFNIGIQMVSTNEIKTSILIERKDADKVIAAIHNKFFPEVVDQ